MSEIAKKLREGVVCRGKRWSGDTFHEFSTGEVDDVETDALMAQAADEIDCLRDALSKSAPIVAQGYWHADQMDREDAEQFIDAAEAIHAAGMWPDESGPL